MNEDHPRHQVVEIFGDLDEVLPYTQPVYRRTIQTRPVTFTCEHCTQTVTQHRFPGPLPRYCDDWCRRQGQRSRTRSRVQRFRVRQHDPAAPPDA